MNSLMFPADAYTKPYPKGSRAAPVSRQGTKAIRHVNTNFPDRDDTLSDHAESRRGTSPSRSLVQAAVTGTPCGFPLIRC